MIKATTASSVMFAAATGGMTAYALVKPSYELEQLVDPATTFVGFRVGVALLILLAAWLVRQRQVPRLGRPLLHGAGAVLLSLGLLAIVSPTLLGALDSYTALGDVFLAIEGGVLALLAADKLPRPVVAQRHRRLPVSLLRPQRPASATV